MNPPTNTDALHGIQDGYTLAISDYLGADMPCYQAIQTDLQAGMDLNGSEVRFPTIFGHHIYIYAVNFRVRFCLICVICNGVLTSFFLLFLQNITVMDDSIYGSLGDIGNFSGSSLFFLQLRALHSLLHGTCVVHICTPPCLHLWFADMISFHIFSC